MKRYFTKWIPVFVLTILAQFSIQAQEKVPVERCHQFLQGVPVNCMQSDDVNMLWVGTNMGLYIFNYFEGVRTIMEGAAVTALAADDKGYMWCSLEGGIVASADKTKRFKIADEDVEIGSMQIRNNEIWLATAAKGVYVWDMKTLEITAHYQASNSDLPSDDINFLFKDEENRIWIGTELGLAIVTGNRWRTNLKKQNITAIGYYDKEVWLAGEGQLWKADDTDLWEPIKVSGRLIRGEVKGMSFDDNGRLYMASDIFSRYNSTDESTFVYDANFGFRERNLLCVGKDKDGDMWVGTEENGLFRFKIFFEEPPKEILSVTATSEKILTCPGDNDGIVKVETKGGEGSYNYQWNCAGCTGDRMEGLPEGKYEITVTDAEGTEIITTTEVVSNLPIKINIEKVKCVSREGARDGELVIKAEGGKGRLTYEWSDSRRTPMRRSLKSGDYEVTVTDTRGCSVNRKLVVSEPRIIPELELTMIEEGQIITMEQMFFDADSLSFNEGSFPALQEVEDFLNVNKNVSIEIGGHTNGLPNHEYCDWLSEGRAKKVAEYFYTQGISPEQVKYKGYGKRNSIASNDTQTGRSKNQRVEIKIIEIK